MKKNYVFLLLFCVFYVSISYGQVNGDHRLLTKLVDKNILTQQEADSIENEEIPSTSKQGFNSTVKKIREGFNTPYIKLGGYGQLVYEYNELANSQGVHDNFRTRLLLIHAYGEITKKIDYFALYDLAHQVLYEYYIDLKLDKKFLFRFGQFKVPFTLENPISLTVLETVYNTRSVSALTGMSGDVQNQWKGINSTGRDLGIQLSGILWSDGEKTLVEYQAGLFQGAGMNTAENNSTKDFAGTLIFQPITGLKLAGGIYEGKAIFANPGESEKHDQVRNRWALSAQYKCSRFKFRSEWIHGNDGGIQKEGLYGMGLFYLSPKKLNLMARVDYFNKNKVNQEKVIDYTTGINWYFAKQCRFQIIYTYSNYSENYGHPNGYTIQNQFQIVF